MLLLLYNYRAYTHMHTRRAHTCTHALHSQVHQSDFEKQKKNEQFSGIQFIAKRQQKCFEFLLDNNNAPR